jgi:hypothetical protein
MLSRRSGKPGYPWLNFGIILPITCHWDALRSRCCMGMTPPPFAAAPHIPSTTEDSVAHVLAKRAHFTDLLRAQLAVAQNHRKLVRGNNCILLGLTLEGSYIVFVHGPHGPNHIYSKTPPPPPRSLNIHHNGVYRLDPKRRSTSHTRIPPHRLN